MFLVLTGSNIERWDGVILTVMNIKMEEEITKNLWSAHRYIAVMFSVFSVSWVVPFFFFFFA